MKNRCVLIFLILSSALLLCSCGSDYSIEPITITGVEIGILESFPPQYVVNVVGVIGACTEVLPEEVRRDENRIRIMINGKEEVGTPCILIAMHFERTINLGSDFESGEYTVIVNGVRARFTAD